MIAFKDGKIFVDEVETIDPELIGFAVLDFNDENEGKAIELIAAKLPVMECITECSKKNL